MNRCISNKTGNPRMIVGQNYQLFEHENPKLVWVKIPDDISSVGYITMQAYISDFKSVERFRELRINSILGISDEK